MKKHYSQVKLISDKSAGASVKKSYAEHGGYAGSVRISDKSVDTFVKKSYAEHGGYAGSVIEGLIQVSKKTFIYRGFTIRKVPRTFFYGRQTYLIHKRDQVEETDNYYGRDFALAEACLTINRLLKNGRFTVAR